MDTQELGFDGISRVVASGSKAVAHGMTKW